MNLLHIGLPDTFIDHGTREECLAEAGLDADGIQARINARLARLGHSLQLGEGAAQAQA